MIYEFMKLYAIIGLVVFVFMTIYDIDDLIDLKWSQLWVLPAALIFCIFLWPYEMIIFIKGEYR